jgi:hypothetical protein
VELASNVASVNVLKAVLKDGQQHGFNGSSDADLCIRDVRRVLCQSNAGTTRVSAL